jgi:hypothetical protein
MSWRFGQSRTDVCYEEEHRGGRLITWLVAVACEDMMDYEWRLMEEDAMNT